MQFLCSVLILFTVAAALCTGITAHGEESVSNGQLSVSIDGDRYKVNAAGRTFATGELKVHGKLQVRAITDRTFGKGRSISATGSDGASETFSVYASLPFVVHSATIVNSSSSSQVLNKVPGIDVTLDLGVPAERLSALGTGGLRPVSKNEGSYAWMAVADPQNRSGVVGGWLTHERGSGVVFAGPKDGAIAMEARGEYGQLLLMPGAKTNTESFVLGWFADSRLGLEAWADAVAKQMNIHLPPMPIVYCTWYDNVHGGSSDEKSLAELSAFAAKELKPYGLTTVQIDDGWQMGDSKGNGPHKNFSAYNPNGPYKFGMLPMAQKIKADGLTAGLWILPFGGSYNDPFFEPHQDWFVKTADGKPFDTAWGGTALDMTQPGAREFVRGEIELAVHEWKYDYLKLDGLSTGAGVHPQYVNDAWKEDNLGDGYFADKSKPNIEVFRDGLRLIRSAAGPKTFILGCCAPQNMRSYAGVFGLVNAMRMGPDNGGSFSNWQVSPDFGSRNYHLNGRIWWSDPDPIYVRESIPLESARCIASWNGISGQMVSLSDWLPTLPAERLDIIRRCIPGHGVSARPVDLFDNWPPRQWIVSDTRPNHTRRDVVGLFNWSEKPEDVVLPVSRMDLPKAAEYIAFDFWANALLPSFEKEIRVSLQGDSCRVLAVRPLLPHPFLISTSRHVSQGILEVKHETWDAAARSLSGSSAVVAGDRYELRIVARGSGRDNASATVSAEDVKAGVAVTTSVKDGLVRVVITSPASREVSWHVSFAGGR